MTQAQAVRTTSIDQFQEEETEGRNARRRREVLAAIDAAESEWVSGRQMWKRCVELGYATPPGDVYGSYQPRLNELVKQGLLEESDDLLECPVTGNQVTHYRRTASYHRSGGGS